ncbi:MAG: PPC domain-containing protein [Chitinophagaceae bacterium]
MKKLLPLLILQLAFPITQLLAQLPVINEYKDNTSFGMQMFLNVELFAQSTSSIQFSDNPKIGIIEPNNAEVTDIETSYYFSQKYDTPPANDDCNGAINLSVGTDKCNAKAYAGSTQLATASTGVAVATCDASTNVQDVWFKFTPTSNDSITIDINNGTGTFITQLLTGTCGSFTEMGCASGTSNNFKVIANTTYYIRVYIAGGSSSFKIKAYQLPSSGAFNFEHTPYYIATGNALTNSNTTLADFNYSTAPQDHPLLNDGIYFAITNLDGQNIWMRVRHIASDPNGTGIGFNVPETQSSPFRSGGFGGWWGFLYQFDIYKDENLVGCRSNTLN